MPLIQVKALVASTGPVAKYPDWELPLDALEQMAAALEGGSVPMLLEHDVTNPVEATVVDASVVPLDDGHHAVEAVLEFEAETWERIRAEFETAGVIGGMSYRATAVEVRPKSGEEPLVSIAVDAAAWTDDDRAAAGALLDAIAPTQTELLFEYSQVDLATVVLEIARDVGIGVLGGAAFDAVKLLIRKRPHADTVIEIHRRDAAGSELTAVVVTNDPAVAREALKQLEQGQPAATVRYDSKRRLWLEA